MRGDQWSRGLATLVMWALAVSLSWRLYSWLWREVKQLSVACSGVACSDVALLGDWRCSTATTVYGVRWLGELRASRVWAPNVGVLLVRSYNKLTISHHYIYLQMCAVQFRYTNTPCNKHKQSIRKCAIEQEIHYKYKYNTIKIQIPYIILKYYRVDPNDKHRDNKRLL